MVDKGQLCNFGWNFFGTSSNDLIRKQRYELKNGTYFQVTSISL